MRCTVAFSIRDLSFARLVLVGALSLAVSLTGCRSTISASGERPSVEPESDGKLPAAAFFRAPLLSHATLSPDGRHVAAVRAQGDTDLLVVLPLGGGKIRPLAKVVRRESNRSSRSSVGIRKVGWGSNERILVSMEMPSQNPYVTVVRARQSRLMVVELNGEQPRYLGKNWPYQEYSQYQDDIISWLPRDPDHILMSWWRPGQSGKSAYRVNIMTGALSNVARFRPFVTGWAADHRGHVRVGWGGKRTGTTRFLYARIGPEGRFEEILRWDPFEDGGFGFAGFSEDPSTVYMWSNRETGRWSLYSYDLAKGQLGERIFGHLDVDAGAIVQSDSGRLLAVRYDTDKPQLHFVDEGAEREQAAIDRALPDTVNRIIDWDLDERLVIVHASADTVPPKYYLFDRESRKLSFLFEAYPELDGTEFAPMKPITFDARDGIVIHGYLTLPVGAEPHNLPTIVLPHGGPWARDVWGWNAEVQFLASRGFAVFQLNFRGSIGYGARHKALGYGEFGLEMQDDITDGARWLIEQGIADPGRMGIFGISYGGYASLQALVKTPDLFRAGASYAGVTDLITMLNDDEHYLFFEGQMERMVGDEWEDREYLVSVSPARQADRIKAPVLIAHGTQDPRVHVKQANAMADALEAAGGEVELHLYRDEVHGFLDERNRIDFYSKLAAFFERHLAASRAQTRTGEADAHRSGRGTEISQAGRGPAGGAGSH